MNIESVVKNEFGDSAEPFCAVPIMWRENVYRVFAPFNDKIGVLHVKSDDGSIDILSKMVFYKHSNDNAKAMKEIIDEMGWNSDIRTYILLSK